METPIFIFPSSECTEDSAPKKDIPPPEEFYRLRLSDCELAIMADDKERFLDAINGENGSLPPTVSLRSINLGLFLNDASKCAEAVLEGKAKPLTSSHAFFFDGFYELHNAARYQSLKITRLFVEHDKNRAMSNARCDARLGFCEAEVLPLHIALAIPANGLVFADWVDRNGGSDAFKLICRLCAPSMRHSLEIARLIALKTNKIEKEALNYAMEGKIVEFSILLMVASEKVLRTPVYPEIEDNVRKMLSGKIYFLFSFLAAILAQSQQRGSCNTSALQECMEKKDKLKQILVLLQIFETIGDKLAKYLQLEQPKPSFVEVTRQVGHIFEEGGIHSRLEVVEEDPMNKTYYRQIIGDPHGIGENGIVHNVLPSRLSLVNPLRYDLKKWSAYTRSQLRSSRALSFATVDRDVPPIKPMRYARKYVPQVCDQKLSKLLSWGTLTRALKHA
ncbi:unnamed protein product [Cuscuta campestris]|uniref:Uncharacterized protein n=1 Tax=Cuscuta campestris TaxID=132261 RepID=A0A484M827_9ASTE|nr:unnamed protein product [Cuscuta campestris]